MTRGPPRSPARRTTAAAVLALLAGCAAPGATSDERVVAGHEDGTVPSPNSLGVFVKADDGPRVLVDFDAEDWLVHALEDELVATKRLIVVRGVALEWKQELEVRSILEPGELNEYRVTTAASRAESQAIWSARHGFDLPAPANP